jgi:hypothetical protein
MCFERDKNGRLRQTGFQLRRTWWPRPLRSGLWHRDFLRMSRIGELCLKREAVFHDIWREYSPDRGDDNFIGQIAP